MPDLKKNRVNLSQPKVRAHIVQNSCQCLWARGKMRWVASNDPYWARNQKVAWQEGKCFKYLEKQKTDSTNSISFLLRSSHVFSSLTPPCHPLHLQIISLVPHCSAIWARRGKDWGNANSNGRRFHTESARHVRVKRRGMRDACAMRMHVVPSPRPSAVPFARRPPASSVVMAMDYGHSRDDSSMLCVEFGAIVNEFWKAEKLLNWRWLRWWSFFGLLWYVPANTRQVYTTIKKYGSQMTSVTSTTVPICPNLM